MLRTTCFPIASALAAFAFACPLARAHNLYVFVEHRADRPDVVHVIFEHSPRPGKGDYNEPLLARGKTWVRTPDGEQPVTLSLREVTTSNDKKFLRTETTSSAPRAIVHSCEFGIYRGRLDYFHGKYLDVTSRQELDRLARTPELPLDMVPHATSDSLRITVLFNGKPLPGTKVWIWSPDGKETTRKTDSAGRLALDNPARGVYSFATVHTLRDAAGEYQGEAYQGLMHGTTLSLQWPLK